jgi:hypothetical protein
MSGASRDPWLNTPFSSSFCPSVGGPFWMDKNLRALAFKTWMFQDLGTGFLPGERIFETFIEAMNPCQN